MKNWLVIGLLLSASLGNFCLLYIDAIIFSNAIKGGLDAFLGVFFAGQAYSYWDKGRRETYLTALLYSIKFFSEQCFWYKDAFSLPKGQLTWYLIKYNPFLQPSIVEYMDAISQAPPIPLDHIGR
jgi:hypothetical protein